MSRPVILVAVVLAAAAASTITVLVTRSEPARMSDEQRAAREKFFGADKELPPIEKGQEMRPRW